MPNSSLDPNPKLPTKFIGAVEDHWQLFSDNSADYTVEAPIGFGASSIVYSATYTPQSGSSKPIPCALKVLDLDSLPPRSLSLLQRETTLMSLSKHPNVLRVRGSWIDGHKLYIALRLMSKGSAADVMQYGWPGGMEEEVIRCILNQALQGLNYLHVNGFIHRDIKAANLLIDDDGTVLLGDLGVAADMAEDPSHHSSAAHHTKPYRTTAQAAVSEPGAQHHIYSSDSESGPGAPKRIAVLEPNARPIIHKRKSFVGTPCWMAPEIIQGKQYDSSADIWSFAITALELAQGRPPRSRENPQKVLLKTVQDAPPVLDRVGGSFKYSKAFQEVIEACLAKDPAKRPTAEQLLQMPFFKNAKKPPYLVNAILKDLPPLAQRQQRRALPSHQTRASIDSWDFATTIHSTIKTGFSNHHTPSSYFPEGVFEMEAEPNTARMSWIESPIDEVEGDAESQPDSSEYPSTESPGDSDFVQSQTSGTSPASSMSLANPKYISIKRHGQVPTDMTEQPRLSSSYPTMKTLTHSISGASLSATNSSIGHQGSSTGIWKRLKQAARQSMEKGKNPR